MTLTQKDIMDAHLLAEGLKEKAARLIETGNLDSAEYAFIAASIVINYAGSAERDRFLETKQKK